MVSDAERFACLPMVLVRLYARIMCVYIRTLPWFPRPALVYGLYELEHYAYYYFFSPFFSPLPIISITIEIRFATVDDKEHVLAVL